LIEPVLNGQRNNHTDGRAKRLMWPIKTAAQ